MFADTRFLYIIRRSLTSNSYLQLEYIDWLNIHFMSYFNLSADIIKYELFLCTDKYWLIFWINISSINRIIIFCSIVSNSPSFIFSKTVNGLVYIEVCGTHFDTLTIQTIRDNANEHVLQFHLYDYLDWVHVRKLREWNCNLCREMRNRICLKAYAMLYLHPRVINR